MEEPRVDLAEAARRADAADLERLPACDLVMKGGITSGVVYPGAVLALAGHHRFRSIGGSSAGAIAAGICAAAEYGRVRGAGGMTRLEEATRVLAERDDFLLGLFQPTPATRDGFALALHAARGGGPPWRRLLSLWVEAARRKPLPGLVATLLVAAIVVLVAGAFGGLPDGVALGLAVLAGVPLVALVLATEAAATIGWVALSTARGLRGADFGFCPGSRQPGHPAQQPALIDWLDETVRTCAGLDEGEVLTFGDLRRAGLTLRMTTTDLNGARPVILPDDLGRYFFTPREWSARFPEHVVRHLVAAAGSDAPLDSDEQLVLPPDDLPVVVGIRLSLSFPLLLSAMPLHREGRRHLFSDGGICSNFPIHFFDAWFPAHPTFGLDLVEADDASEPVVRVPRADMVEPPRFAPIGGAGAFLAQVVDAMQNWRDTLQSELPGFRDRVCQIALRPGEGGLNLQMKLDAIGELMRRGYAAGEELRRELPVAAPGDEPTERWVEHAGVRWRMLMAKQQEGLQDVDAKVPWFLERFAPAPGARECARLLALARAWGTGGEVDFGADRPVPDPLMRIVPPQ